MGLGRVGFVAVLPTKRGERTAPSIFTITSKYPIDYSTLVLVSPRHIRSQGRWPSGSLKNHYSSSCCHDHSKEEGRVLCRITRMSDLEDRKAVRPKSLQLGPVRLPAL